MNTALKLSLIALIAAVFCPGCTESSAGDPSAVNAGGSGIDATAPAPQAMPETLETAVAWGAAAAACRGLPAAERIQALR